MPQTYYEVLGITQEASDTDIKAAYREAVLKLHPDKSAAIGIPADSRSYEELQTAWTVQTASILVHIGIAPYAIHLFRSQHVTQVTKDACKGELIDLHLAPRRF